jgi:hypothetical protein
MIMPKFEVMYKVYDDETRRTYTGPSDYTVVVEAMHQGAAQQMVQNMNGGERCQIIRAMHVVG